MTTSKLFNLFAAVVACLTVAGALHLSEAINLFDYVNGHLGTMMAVVFYTSVILSFMVAATVVALMAEVPMWESGNRLARELATTISNARNSWAGMVGGAVLGGSVGFLAVWGVLSSVLF